MDGRYSNSSNGILKKPDSFIITRTFESQAYQAGEIIVRNFPVPAAVMPLWWISGARRICQDSANGVWIQNLISEIKKPMATIDLKGKFTGQAQMLANKVKKKYKHLRKKYVGQNLEVFRLYDWYNPEIRAVADGYAGHLVVGEYSRKPSTSDWLLMMGRAVADILNVPQDKLHLKIRKTGMKEGACYQRLNHVNFESKIKTLNVAKITGVTKKTIPEDYIIKRKRSTAAGRSLYDL